MLDAKDLTYYKENGNIMCGGYNVNDILKYQGENPHILEVNQEDQEQGQIGGTNSLNSSLGVPSGIFYITQKVTQTEVPFSEKEMIPDDLYENLLQLINHTSKYVPKKSVKNKNKDKRKEKKSKKKRK